MNVIGDHTRRSVAEQWARDGCVSVGDRSTDERLDRHAQRVKQPVTQGAIGAFSVRDRRRMDRRRAELAAGRAADGGFGLPVATG